MDQYVKSIQEFINYYANDLWHTPYQTTHRVVLLYKSNPGLNYNEQAELLKVTYNDIVRAWSYINMLNIR